MPGTIHYIMLVILIPLFAWLCWREWKRTKKKRLLGRLLATLLIFISFILLLFPPQQKAGKNGTSRQAIIVTEGTDKDSLAHLLQSLPENSKAYTHWQYQYEQPAAIDTLHIIGYGLPLEDWRSLRTTNIQWHEPAVPAGIQAVDWKRLLRLGDVLTVFGHYRNHLNQPVILKLTWEALVQDSLLIPPNTDTVFQLQAGTYYAGTNLYQVETQTDHTTTSIEPIPVYVMPAEKLRILLLANAPGFETNFLVNWLAKEGYPLAVSNQISQAKWSKSFINMEPIPLEQIGVAQLEKFDLLIMDPLSFSTRNAGFQAAVKKQVEQGALGVLFQTDSSVGNPSWYNRRIRLSPPVSKQGLRFRTISNHAGARPLLTDSTGTRSALLRAGRGYIVFNTRLNSFSWQLEGKTPEYQRFWKQLLEAAAPPIAVPDTQALAYFPVAGESTRFAQPADSAAWLSTAGWQKGGWYVFNPNDWKTARAMQTIEQSRDYVQQRRGLKSDERPTGAAIQVTEPIQPWLILLLFFLPAIFLWVEKKLD